MKEYNSNELNEVAMSIILHAGNCRNYINSAVSSVLNKEDDDVVNDYLDKAKNEIVEAHRIQTDVIQSTILNEEQKITLLFTHAQDTLMTIDSELELTKNMIKLVKTK